MFLENVQIFSVFFLHTQKKRKIQMFLKYYSKMEFGIIIKYSFIAKNSFDSKEYKKKIRPDTAASES